jgi:hypothetical protein
LAAAIVQPPEGQKSQPTYQCQEPPPLCEIVHVGDVTIVVNTGNVDDVGQNITATRWLSVEEGGGYLTVWAFQGWVEYPGGNAPVVHPGLATFPFTKQQLAELAASAEMFPPR